MQNLDRNYILIGLGWVVIGTIFGTWLGATNQANYANSHAHINLLGFVTSTLFGLLHRSYPALANSRLALWQFVIFEVGVLLLVIGKVLVDGGRETPFLYAGALLTILGVLLMLVMFVRHGNKAAA